MANTNSAQAIGIASSHLPAPLERAPSHSHRDVGWTGANDGQKGKETEAFWRAQLKGFSAATPLPMARSPGETCRSADPNGQDSLELSPALTDELIAVAAANHITLQTVALAVWALLLGRHSGGNDVVFGTVRDSRRRPAGGVEAGADISGHPLPVRVSIDDDLPVAAWLRGLHAQWLELLSHEPGPLIQVQDWSEILPGRSLFETLVDFENALPDGPRAHRHSDVHGPATHPLTVAVEGGPPLTIRIFFDRRRVADEAVSRLLGHCRTVLEAMAADPGLRVGLLPLLTADERRQLLTAWNRTEADFPRTQCAHRLFEAQAARSPDRIAVADGRTRLTYGELNARANQLAHRLQSLGIGPESLVGVCLERSVEMIAAWLGILKAGGAFVPFDLAHPPERQALLLQDSGVRVLLTKRELCAALPVASAEVKVLCLDPEWTSLAGEAKTNPDSGAGPGNLAYVIYVSDSTGEPKGVLIEHHSLVNLVTWHRQTYRVTPADRATQLASPALAAAVWEVWPYLTAGASIHIPDEETTFSPAKLPGWLKRNKITLAFLPPPLAEAVMAGPWPRGGTLRALLIEGENPVGRRPKNSACALFNHYGPAEATTVCAWTPVERKSGAGVAASLGRPVANTKVYVLDRNLRPVPVGVPGELFVGGESVARGYLHRRELTAEKFIADPVHPDGTARFYRTGDRVRWRPDGRLEFLGRPDQQVELRGHRIELEEIEVALARHPAVRRAVVTMRPEPRGGRLAAYLLPEFRDTPDAAELRWFLARSLPDCMVPASFVWLKELPLTAQGGVDRAALPEPDPGPEKNAASPAPRTPVEAALAAIWNDALDLTAVGIHDNFFQLGGHPLLAAQVAARLGAELGVQLPLRELFDHPTIAELAASVERTGVPIAADGQSPRMP